jgi:hypothetical protein
MYGGEERCTQGLVGGNVKEKVNFVIFKWIFKRGNEGIMDWTDLDQERNRWRALVNAIRNLRIP